MTNNGDRKKAHWIACNGLYKFRCSECGSGGNNSDNFCACCGSSMKQNIDDKLKSCPFCGGTVKASMYYNGLIAFCAMRCKKCHIKTEVYTSKAEEAVELWNRRVENAEEQRT